MKFNIVPVLLLVALQVFAANDRVKIQGKDLFLSGINVAWDRYANDVGGTPINENYYREVIVKTRAAGGNVIRMWLSTNGKNDPVFSPSTGLVTGLGTETINNVQKVLDLAEENGVVVSLCLLTHNLLQDGQGAPTSNNVKLLTTDEGLQAYIDNALVPLVTAIGNHPAIAAWEIFNEAEGMVAFQGWATYSNMSGFTMQHLQKFVNRTAGAIKSVNDSILVSSGTHTFKYLTDVGGYKNYYSDAELVAAGGDPLGKLDFYQVHFYPEHQGNETSPFHHPASYWGLDKPIVVGEFPNSGITPVEGKFKPTSQLTPTAAYNYLYDNGYAGGISWAYNGSETFGFFDDVKPAMTDLYSKHQADLFIKELPLGAKEGEYAMKINLTDVSNSIRLKISNIPDISANTELSISLKIDSIYAGESIKVGWITQSGSDYKWVASQNKFTVPNSGEWTTYTIPLTDLSGTNFGDLRSLILDIQTSTNVNFSGVLLVDDVISDGLVISDFNDQFGLWSPFNSLIEKISAVNLENIVSVVKPSISQMANFEIIQNKQHILIQGVQPKAVVKLYSIDGKEILANPIRVNETSLQVELPETQKLYLISIEQDGIMRSHMLMNR